MAASALYACTKCTQRYPFEELSQGQQLCKVRGRWAAGGRGFLGRSPRESGCPLRCSPALFVCALGAWSSFLPPHSGPLYRGRGHQMGGAPERRQDSALFQAAQEGAGPHQHSGVSGGAERGGSHLSMPQKPWGGDIFISVFCLDCPLLPPGGRGRFLHFLARNLKPQS